MRDIAEINKEIARLEFEESSYPNYAKLADLYIIKRQMQGGEPVYNGYSMAAAPQSDIVYTESTSDFLKAVNGKDSKAVWAVMDELMDSLRITNPNVYRAVLRRIDKI